MHPGSARGSLLVSAWLLGVNAPAVLSNVGYFFFRSVACEDSTCSSNRILASDKDCLPECETGHDLIAPGDLFHNFHAIIATKTWLRPRHKQWRRRRASGQGWQVLISES